MEERELLDVLDPFIKNGEFVIEYMFLNLNHSKPDIDLWYSDNFEKSILKTYEGYNIDDVVITAVNQRIIDDIASIYRYYNRPEDEIESNVQNLIVKTRDEMEYHINFMNYYPRLSEDYKHELINKTIKFFTPIPVDQYRYIDTYDNAYRYHTKIFEDSLTSTMVRLLNIINFDVTVFDIEKTEDGVEVFHIRTPDYSEKNFVAYQCMDLMFDFETFFENLYREYRYKTVVCRHGYEKANHQPPVKVKAIVSHQDVDPDKIEAYNDAYRQYITLFANNITKKRKENK